MQTGPLAKMQKQTSPRGHFSRNQGGAGDQSVTCAGDSSCSLKDQEKFFLFE